MTSQPPVTNGPVTPCRPNLETLPGDYATDGAKMMMHGFNYQLKLLSLYLCRALIKSNPDNPNQDISSFRIGTEMEAAGKFDDIILHYQKGDVTRWLFLQAKHKSNTGADARIKISDLLPELYSDLTKCNQKTKSKKEQLSLSKYFVSFRKIESNPQFAELKDYIICTNLDFDLSDKYYYAGTKFIHLKNMFSETDDDILGNKMYKFNDKFHGEDLIVKTIAGSPEVLKLGIEKQALNNAIKKYLKALQFAVDQPNDEEFEKLIKKDISQLCNIRDSEMIYKYISQCMYDWFSDIKGTFLTRNAALQLFEKAENIGNKYKLIGLSTNNCNKFLKKDIVIDKIHIDAEEFINHKNNKLFHLVALDDTKLITLKLIQKLHQMKSSIPHMKHQDSFVLLTAEEIFNNEDTLMKAFCLKLTELLVIHYDLATPQLDKLIQVMDRILKCSNNNKIIIVTNKQEDILKKLSTKFKDITVTLQDTTSFSDLTEAAQTAILDKTVSFQGFDVRLKQLILPDCMDVIDTDFLKRIVYDNVRIVKEMDDIKDIKDYYIERYLRWKRIVDESVFKEKCLADLFVVSNVCSESFGADVEVDKQVFVVEREKAVNKFMEICTSASDEMNVHWLDKDKNRYIWKKSKGNLSHLRKFIKNDTSYKLVNTIADIDDRIVLLSAEPGMGKTTLLTRLAKQSKVIDPTSWIIKLNLNDYIGLIQKTFIAGPTDAVNFLISTQEFSYTFELELFRSYMRSPDKVTLMLDGFDEISPNYKNKVMELLKYFLEMPFEKIWVSTRMHEQNDLEDHLSVVSFSLKPFTETDQNNFLLKFWSCSLAIPNDTKDVRLMKYIKSLLEITSKCLCDSDRSLTGIPLLTRLLAEGFEEDLKKFYASKNTVPKFTDKIDILILYERFVRNKFDRFLNLKAKKGDALAADEIYEMRWKIFIKKHKLFSLWELFGKDQFKLLISSNDDQNTLQEFQQEIRKGTERIGIVCVSSDGNVHFIHRTFGEYFAALWFQDNVIDIQQGPAINFLKTNLLKSKNQVIRHFFDRLVANNSPVHAAILNNDKYAVQGLISAKKFVIKSTDRLKRNPLHLAAVYGYTSIIEILMRHHADTNATDKLFNWVPIMFAIETKKWDAVNYLLNDHQYLIKPPAAIKSSVYLLLEACKHNYINLANVIVSNMSYFTAFNNNKILTTAFEIADSKNHLVVANLVRKNIMFFSKNVYGDDCENLYIAASSNDFYSVKYLIQEGAAVNACTELKWTALHAAAARGNNDIVKLLLDANANVNARTRATSTPLHLAVMSGKLDTVKCLMLGGANIDARGDENMTPLHHAVIANNLSIVQYLIEEGAKINAKSNDLQTPLYMACEKGYTEIARYLISKDIDRNISLDYIEAAIVNGHLNILVLLPNLIKLNLRTKNNLTLAHIAAAHNQLEILKYLSEFVDHFETTDKLQTPLHLACENGHLDIVMYLINERREDIHFPTTELDTPLHIAARNNQTRIIDFLITRVANVNAFNSRHETPLHIVASSGHSDMFAYLSERGAFTECLNVDDETPWMVAVRKGYLPILEYMSTRPKFDAISAMRLACRYGHLDMVTFLRNQVDPSIVTASLHIAVQNDHEKIVRFLIENSADVNMKLDNIAPLHIAVRNESKEIINQLINADTIDVNVTTDNGLTPLHIATRNGRLDIIIELFRKRPLVDPRTQNEETPLHFSTHQGYLYIIKYLLKKGASVNARMKGGITALHMASKAGRLDIIQYLLKEDADINATDSFGETALYAATSCGHLETVKYLYNDLADINKCTHAEETPLHVACRAGYTDLVDFLVQSGAEIHTRTSDDVTPIHYAIRGGYFEVAEYLITAGAKIDAVPSDCVTSLHIAARENRLDIVEYLIEKGVDINARDHSTSYCPLHVAAICGHFKIVDYLLQKGAGVNVTTNKHFTPLHEATCKNHFEIIKLLVRHHADIGARTNENETVLHLAARRAHLNIIAYYLDKGAAIDARTSYLETPLHIACNRNRMDLVRHLVNRKAHVNAIARTFQTPLYIAACNGNVEMCKFLLSKGAESVSSEPLVNIVTRNGNCDLLKYLVEEGGVSIDEDALHIATRNEHLDIMEYLVKKGADINKYRKNKVPLHIAAEEGDLDVMKFLLDKGVLVNLPTEKYMTALHLAVTRGKIDMVECLLDKKADIGAIMEGKITALHIAVQNGRLDIAGHLLMRGADINAATDKMVTPLHLATQSEEFEMVKQLLIMNANVNCQNDEKITPIHLASFYGRLDLIKCFVVCGGDINARTNKHVTPFYVACRQGHLNIVRYLWNEKIDIDAKTIADDTPLHAATRKGHFEIVKYLINKKASINACTKHLVTPFYIEIKDGRFDSTKYLTRNGIEIESTKTKHKMDVSIDSDPEEVRYLLSADPACDFRLNERAMPLHIAVYTGRLDIARFLLDRGADKNAFMTEMCTQVRMTTPEKHIDIVNHLSYICNNISIKGAENIAALHIAAGNGNTKAVKFLLGHHIDVDSPTSTHTTPLHIASQNGYYDLVLFLLSKGANMDAANIIGETPIHMAAKNGHLQILKYLVNHGAKIDTGTKNTPLHSAVKCGHLNVIKYLLDKGVDIDCINDKNETPLYLASVSGRFDIVKVLLNKGARHDVVIDGNITPLHEASRHGHLEIVQNLINAGADLASLTDDRATPLHYAHKHIDVIECLLSKDVDINAATSDNVTLLHLVARDGSSKTLECLLKDGAEINSCTSDGATPLHVAVRYGNLSIVKRLLNEGSDIDARMDNDLTPLHVAVIDGHFDIAKLLVKMGADMHARNGDGKTVVHFCVENGRLDMFRYFKRKGADLMAKTADGESACDIARRLRRIDFRNRYFQ